MNCIAKICINGGKTFIKNNSITSNIYPRFQFIRDFKTTNQLKESIRSRFNRMRPQERPSGIQQTLAIDSGRAIIIGGAALGLGGLCYYGLSGSSTLGANNLSALDRATLWPDYVRARIHSTYAYLAGGAAIAATSATMLARNATFIRFVTSGGWLAPIGMLIVSIGAGVVCQMIPYPESQGKFNTKHLSWIVYSTSLGFLLAPICLIGGPILTQAALYTGGIVGGLSAVAASAPSDKFLTWGGPLAMGLGVVIVSSFGSMFLSPVSKLGVGMAAVSLYGGLILFSGFLLYDTQSVIRRAEQHPPPNPYGNMYGLQGMSVRPFDPINNSIHILLDTINIFVRMVAILSGGGNRRK